MDPIVLRNFAHEIGKASGKDKLEICLVVTDYLLEHDGPKLVDKMRKWLEGGDCWDERAGFIGVWLLGAAEFIEEIDCYRAIMEMDRVQRMMERPYVETAKRKRRRKRGPRPARAKAGHAGDDLAGDRRIEV